MKVSRLKQRNGSLVWAILCSSALVLPTQARALEQWQTPTWLNPIVVSEPDPIISTVTQGPLGVEAGSTVIVAPGTRFEMSDAVGIDFFGLDLDGVTIINQGFIHTEGTIEGPFYGDGIYVSRANKLSVKNNGAISIGDGESYGIYVANVSKSKVENNGLIHIREDAAEEIIENNQMGLSSGFSGGVRLDSYEAFYDSDDNVIGAEVRTGNLLVNNGTIRSDVLQSRGLYIDGAVGNFWMFTNSTAINNGDILMLADPETRNSGTFDVSGLRVEGHGNTLINNGRIQINPEGFGMDGNGAANTLINNGDIRAYYKNSHGIENYRNGQGRPIDTPHNQTFNFGDIEVWGDNTHGVSLTGHQKHTFFNSGRIVSHEGYSIDVNAEILEVFQNPDNPNDPFDRIDQGDIDLELADGSILYGDVFVYFRDRFDPETGRTTREGADRLTSLALGDGLNATIHFDVYSEISEFNENVTTGGGMPEDVTSFHNSHVVDRERGVIYVADLDSYTQQDQAMWRLSAMLQDAIDTGSGTQRSAGTSESPKNWERRWLRVFGGGLLAPRAGTAPAYDAGSAGLVAGIEAMPLGFHGGFAVSYVEGEEEVSFETTSTSLFAGISGDLKHILDYSLTAGVALNRTDRDQADNRVMGGVDSDSTDYASIFVTPSVHIQGPIEGSSLRLLYTGLWQQGHTFNFSGGTVLSVDDRYANFLQARLQMQHAILFPLSGSNLAYGAEASWSDGQDMNFAIMGTGGLVTPYDDGYYTRFFGRLGSDLGYVEVGYDTEERTTVEAGLTLQF